jgi:hypothetical protein
MDRILTNRAVRLSHRSRAFAGQRAIQIPTMMTVIDTMITDVSIEGHQRVRCSSMGSPFNDDGHFARVCS